MARAGSKPFVCAVCGKSFGRRPDLNRHSLIHEPDAVRYHCAYPGCYHSSLQKSNLKTHYISKHLHQRPHKCHFDGCSSAYGDASALIRHEKRYHGYFRKGRKPYERPSATKADVKIEVDSFPYIECPATPSLWYSSSAAPSPASSTSPSMPSALPFAHSPSQTFAEPQSTDAFLHEMIPEFFPYPKFTGDVLSWSGTRST